MLHFIHPVHSLGLSWARPSNQLYPEKREYWLMFFHGHIYGNNTEPHKSRRC